MLTRRAGLICLVLARTASAGNEDELFVGNRASMTGGVALATVEDGSAVWYNPAGLARAGRMRIDVSGSVYALRIYSAEGLLSTPDGTTVDGGVVQIVAIPSQIAFVRPLGGGVTLGLGYFVPRVSNLLLREDLSVGAAPTTKYQVAISSETTEQVFAAAIGAELTRSLRLGGSLLAGYETVRQSASISGLSSSGATATGFITSSSLATSNRIGLEPAVGLQLDLGPRWTLGLNIRGPRFLVYRDFDESSASAMAQRDAPENLAAAIDRPSDHTLADLVIVKAGRLGAGLSYAYRDRSWVSFESDLQFPLHSADAGIDRAPVVNARGGIFHAVGATTTLGAGLFTDRTSERGKPDGLSGYGDYYGGSVGAEFDHEYRLEPGQGSDALHFSSVFALQYAYSRGPLGRLVVDDDVAVPPRTAQGALVAHEISVYVGSGLSL